MKFKQLKMVLCIRITTQSNTCISDRKVVLNLRNKLWSFDWNNSSKDIIEHSAEAKKNDFRTKWNSKFSTEAQEIYNDLYRGCGLDNSELPELSGASNLISEHDPFHTCVAINAYFNRFHTWHNETFSQNTLKCDLEAIEERKQKHQRWQKAIRYHAGCDDQWKLFSW